MLVKILGAVDLLSAMTFLMLTFGMNPPLQLALFCAGLLMLKGMFVLMGNILSLFDLIASLVLLASLFFDVSSVFLWTPALLLIAKGFASFL